MPIPHVNRILSVGFIACNLAVYLPSGRNDRHLRSFMCNNKALKPLMWYVVDIFGEIKG